MIVFIQVFMNTDSNMWYISKTRRAIGCVIKLHKDYTKKTIIVTSKNAPPKMHNDDFVTSYHHMFDGRTDIEEVIFEEDIDTSYITSIRAMFRNCTNL